MNATALITWHTKDGFAIQEPFPKGLEGKRYIERLIESERCPSLGKLELGIYSSVKTQVYMFDYVELLYFQCDNLQDPLEKRKPVYTSHYNAQ